MKSVHRDTFPQPPKTHRLFAHLCMIFICIATHIGLRLLLSHSHSLTHSLTHSLSRRRARWPHSHALTGHGTAHLPGPAGVGAAQGPGLHWGEAVLGVGAAVRPGTARGGAGGVHVHTQLGEGTADL